MKTPQRLFALTIALSALVASACKQSAIFYTISTETKPRTALIKGSPTKLVPFNGKTWTANGQIFAFDGAAWTSVTGPSNRIIRDVAGGSVTGTDSLFVLAVDENGTDLFRTTDETNWVELTNGTAYASLDAVFVAGNEAFVGARVSGGTNNYAVLRVNGAALEVVKTGLAVGGNLVGAVLLGGNYYLATTQLGIFAGTDLAALGTAIAVTLTGATWVDALISGMTSIGATTVVAVGGNGHIVAGDSGGFTVSTESSSYEFTGGLYVDDLSGADDMLYAGLRASGSTYVYGYAEILLTGGALPATPAIHTPGTDAASPVIDKAQYNASLGTVPVNYLYRHPGGALFAATVAEGLWVYADSEWNAQN